MAKITNEVRKIANANQAYGALTEGLYLAGFTFERAMTRVLALLKNGDWKTVGDGFDDVNAFVRSLRLDQLKVLADQRQEFAERVKALQPKVSNRAIASALGVDEGTIRKAGAENSALDGRKAKQNGNAGAENSALALTGAQAAGFVDRRERASAQRARNAETARTPAPPPEGKFETLVIDPPWPMEKIERDVRPKQVAFDYPTMSEAELLAFGETVNRVAADDCHLFVWTTQRFLRLALDLIEPWGFRYGGFVMGWMKSGGFQPVGLPQFNLEYVVYARKGSPRFVDTKSFFCGFTAPRREHSRKPDEFYDLISRVTAGPRLDMFSREPRPGFVQHGNETQRFTDIEHEAVTAPLRRPRPR